MEGMMNTKLQVFCMSVLAAFACGASAIAAEDDGPKVSVNTNTINAIVSAVPTIGTNTPASVIAKLPDLIKFYGVMSITEAGSASGGAAALVSLLKISKDAIEVDVGPAYVCGIDGRDDFFQAVELAGSMQFPAAGKIQEKFAAAFEGVPVLDLLPRYINVSGMKSFLGAGATLDGKQEWSPTGWCVSAGITGIKIGK